MNENRLPDYLDHIQQAATDARTFESSENIFIRENLNYSLALLLGFNHLNVEQHGDR